MTSWLDIVLPPFNISFNQDPYLFIELYILPIGFLISTALIRAPFGKFSRKGFGPLLPGKIAFFTYEALSGVTMFYILYTAMYKSFKVQQGLAPTVKPTLPLKVLFLGFCYIGHYLYRSVIYTFFISHSMKPQSLLVALCGAGFNILNGYNNAIGLLQIKDMTSSLSWAGVLCFYYGLEINIRSDVHLAKLRKHKQQKGNEANQEYFIPFAGYFKYVSCANYFGECLEWFGWALLCNNLAGWAFFFCTLGNLVPRAISTHNWYKQQFPTYPKNRKALIPFLF